MYDVNRRAKLLLTTHDIARELSFREGVFITGMFVHEDPSRLAVYLQSDSFPYQSEGTESPIVTLARVRAESGQYRAVPYSSEWPKLSDPSYNLEQVIVGKVVKMESSAADIITAPLVAVTVETSPVSSIRPGEVTMYLDEKAAAFLHVGKRVRFTMRIQIDLVDGWDES